MILFTYRTSLAQHYGNEDAARYVDQLEKDNEHDSDVFSNSCDASEETDCGLVDLMSLLWIITIVFPIVFPYDKKFLKRILHFIVSVKCPDSDGDEWTILRWGPAGDHIFLPANWRNYHDLLFVVCWRGKNVFLKSPLSLYRQVQCNQQIHVKTLS